MLALSIPIFPVDRYPYLGTLYYLTSVYLRRIGALFYIFLHNFIYTSLTKRLSCFWRRCRGKSVFYANINTKCFFNISNIFYVYICVVFEFLILFVFILHKFLC